MIKSFDYSHVIDTQIEIDAIRKIDDLFLSGIWCNDIQKYPKYQTWPDLFMYKELEIFADCFIDACNRYCVNNYNNIKLWCYMDYASNTNNHENLWHTHGDLGLSGVYYLRNPDNVYTEFQTIKMKDVKPFHWHIFPANLHHRPPKPLTESKRYTLAGDYTI